MGVEGTQPAQDIGIFQTQSMCLGGAKKSLQSSLEKEEDRVLVLPVAKGVWMQGSRRPIPASSGAEDGVLSSLCCPVTVLDSFPTGRPVIPTSLACLFLGWGLGEGLPTWENATLSKSTGTAGQEPLCDRRGCGLVVVLLSLRWAALSSSCWVSWGGRIPGADTFRLQIPAPKRRSRGASFQVPPRGIGTIPGDECGDVLCPASLPGDEVSYLLGCFYLEFLQLISLVSRGKKPDS